MQYSVEEIKQYAAEEDVKFIRMAFCDAAGRQKNIAIMPEELDRAFQYGIAIDGSAIPGFGGEVHSDLLLRPDPSTLCVLPWRPEHGRVVRMFCAVTQPDGTVIGADARSLLKKTVEDAKKAGLTFAFGTEMEFYLFRLDEDGEPTKIPYDRAGYMDIAPADKGENVCREACLTLERMVAALRELGFNYVFDTDFAADLTIMEEGSEFIERFTHKDQYQWPMFTSCCPGWVRFVKSQYPELTDNLSTAKSPQQMFGAVAKSYFAEKVGIDPKRLFVVSIMPCVSKKSECALPTMKNDAGDPDVDVSITTRELNIMMRANHIEPKYLPEEEFDSPLGSATGAAVVFGTTGGVMDAALRSAYFLITGKNPDPDAFTAVRGMDGWKEATFNIPGAGDVRVAVVSSLGKARKLIEAVKRGDAAYDFVEVMACPGGCAGGGGQPIHDGVELAEDRGSVLWQLDQNELLRFSHENPDVKALYKDYLGAPLGEKSHHLLHTDHFAWEMPPKAL